MKISVSLVAVSLLVTASLVSAHSSRHSYVDLGFSELDTGASEQMDGYDLDYSKSLGKHFSLLLGFDNNSTKITQDQFALDQRVKSKSYGLGFRTPLDNHLDFVIQYSKQRYSPQNWIEPNVNYIAGSRNFNGDTTDLGFRGRWGDIELDGFATRITLGGSADFDELGSTFAARYWLYDRLAVGVERLDVGEWGKTSVNFRYRF